MKTFFCIGDSNTYGFDPRGYIGSRYGEDQRWTGLLKRKGYRVINDGRNGRIIPDRREIPSVCRQLREAGPIDAVTVMLGTNDLLKGASAEETAGRMERFLRALKEDLPGQVVVLIAPPPMIPGEWVQTRALIRESTLIAEEYLAVAQRTQTLYADAGEWGVELTFDGVHFTAAGHAAFAGGLLERLGKIISEDKP